MNPATAAPLCFSHFELHPAERLLRVHGEPVAVGSRAFDLLLVLAERHGRLVGKQELLDLVWPGVVVEEHNIAAQISSLRKLLGPLAITTVAGRGYRLTALPQAATAEPAAAATPPPAAAGPSPAAARSPNHNLPEPRTRFIGREAALAELARLLPATRLLTLTGIGGCGKTRLALQFAREQLEAFDNGVWFVDLAPLKDGERVAATIAAALGLREEGDTPLIERLRAHLAGRRTLLLLDNCEHVIDAVATVAEALLAGSAGTTIVATSREPLGLQGEQIVAVRSLTLPPAASAASADLQALLDAESVRVFVDRARLGCPDFEVHAGNVAPLAEICRRLDGIALAIELAAARVTMLSVDDIAARLDDRFRLLTGGSRALPRHQTLQAAMQWSYDQLAAAEQRMLRQVSVFAGGWTLQAAADVAQTADEYEALALTTALHDKSLLTVDREASPAAASGPRYRMLETVRQYALDRLNECGEGEAARGRHFAHFLALAEAAEPQIRGPRQDAWIARLRQEHDNLIAALTWCSEPAVDARAGLRLAAATSFYWLWNGVQLGHALTRGVLDRYRSAADTPERARALASLAQLSLFRGRYEDSLTESEQALAIARRLGDERALLMALRMNGSALETTGAAVAALSRHEEALALAREIGETAVMAPLLNSIAEVKRSQVELDTAERRYREALELSRAQGGRFGIVTTLNNLIRVLVAQGRPQPAKDLARECLGLVGREKIGVDLLDAAVGLAAGLGEHERAARFWGAADRLLTEWGYKHQPVDIEHTARWLAVSRAALGDAAFDAAVAAGRALDFDAALGELERWLQAAHES